MNFFNFFKPKPEEFQSKIDLRKKEVAMCLKNTNISKARVAIVIDCSGSMKELYENGQVQDVVERILPIALNLDDNKELDMWIFSYNSKKLKNVTESNLCDYTKKHVIPHVDYGGTNYQPVMKDIVHEYVDKNPINYPSYVIFITDGDNSDRSSTTELIIESSKYNIFWQFVGIGNNDFNYLKSLDTMTGRFVDNANFFEIENLSKISDSELYSKLLTEFPSWITEAKRLKLII